MHKILIKVLLIIGLLSLSACSDSKNNKEEKKQVIPDKKEELKDKYSKPTYDFRLDNYEYGKVWYDTSAIDYESSYNLGVLYHKNIKDMKLAEFWYLKSWSQMQDSDTANNLGFLYDDLNDYNNSVKWYKKSNTKNSIFNLGLLYEEKIKNNEKAIIYYTKAYKLGHIDVTSNLGLLYKINFNDEKKAIDWYKKGIERESQLSIRNISSLYHVQGNDIKAVAYLISIVALNPKYTKDKVIKYMKTKWKVNDETIKKGYELQLKMDGLSKRYTGGL